MELRARIRPLSRRAVFVAALVALVASAVAGAVAPSAHAAKKKAPVITSVAPLDVAVGETLTIRGRHFITGRNKNTVVFKRSGARAVFVKAAVGTKKLLRVTVPVAVQKQFLVKSGNPVPTRFRLRVLAKKLSKRFTSSKRSPLVSGPRPPKPVVADDQGDCDSDGTKNGVDGDDDNDLLADINEKAIGTDPCKLDTDGDAVEDGYEWQSAKDLNDDEYQQPNKLIAYPHKTPYPNPGFGDGATDYDGDSLTLKEEYDLWVYTYSISKTDPRSLEALSYSDGEQYTRSRRVVGGSDDGRRQPTLAAVGYDKNVQFVDWAVAAGYRTVHLEDPFAGAPWWDTGAVRAPFGLFDMNRVGGETPDELTYYDLRDDGYLSDDERDEDADGLTNYDETHGRMLPSYWKSCYEREAPFHIGYGGTNHVDADTDGDGVLDGADDQDHDDLPNVMELSRVAASGLFDGKATCVPQDGLGDVVHPNAYGRVHPFNPCLPARQSRTCPKIVSAATGAPWDGSPTWWSLQ
jgi:IPT/TIG domain